MTHAKSPSVRSTLLGATAISVLAFGMPVIAQQATTIVPPANTEPDTAPASNTSGFVFSVDGQPINADPAVEDRIRRADIALAEADVQISFDGLNPTPRLAVEMAGDPAGTVTLRSELNYPAYVTRGAFLIYDRDALGGARLLATVPVDPNGTAQVVVPAGADVVAVHRVYDSAGRYDETTPLPLTIMDGRGLTANEDGLDMTAARNIRVGGGAVTVTAANVAPGATLYTLGEAVQADSQGRLVIQRILPPGDYAVDVEVRGGGQNTALSRDFNVPGSEWFYVATGELTYSGIGSDAGEETSGRLSYYVDGETDTGLRITSSLDTQERPLDEVFSRLDERDPRALAQRVDESDGYPTFGDDSTIVDNTPTSGSFYLRIEKDGNFALWGDYQADLSGSSFIRNERSLYGAQAHFGTQDVTANGDARIVADVYAAQPDQLVGRDVFRGTGGSVYFLRQQDVTPGTATLTVELRDADTDRVLDRQLLVEGRDYTINSLQGVVTLARPLSGSQNDGLIQGRPGGDVLVNLIAQYEFTPIGVAVDGLSYGGRVEAWATDDLRIGVTGILDETGVADQRATAVDLRYQLGQNSFVQLDYAETDGPGFGAAFSLDGGLNIDSVAPADGDGRAVRVEAQGDLPELGFGIDGTVSVYAEDRTQGFSTLDYQVAATTGDEQLYGFGVALAPTERVSYALTLDRYENDAGDERTELGAEVAYDATDRLRLAFGAEYLEEVDTTQDGSRTDLAGRITYALNDNADVYGFGQGSVQTDGLEEYNRYGVGVEYTLDSGWSLSGEVSDGTGGVGARILASQSRADNESTYFGYELDPARAIDAGVSQSDNGGRFVAGGRRSLSDRVSVFGENVYDLFGNQQSLTSAYGVEYTVNKHLSYDAALTLGQITDDTNGDFDRRGLSIGTRYADETLTARVRAEVRMDDASADSTRADADVYVLTSDLAYEIDETQRLLASLDATRSESDESAFLDGEFVDVSLGYALRPILNERFNMLARLRYLSDEFGQTIDGVAGAGDVQRSTVASVEGSYDLDPQWTVGAKLGYRASETGADTASLSANDAWLAVANARYHVGFKWDVLIEGRYFEATDAGFSDTGFLAAVYRHVGDHAQIGVGYNFGSFSDDLTDLTTDDGGAFVNIIAQF